MKTNDSAEKLSLICPVPGCKFGGFVKIYDKYQTVLTERLITNNGNHDVVLDPNWNWIDWNYGDRRRRKKVRKLLLLLILLKCNKLMSIQLC